MRLVALCVLVSLLGYLNPAGAQGVPPDTVDWQRYYPLAVDNLWEYHDEEAPGDLFRHTLIADTVIGHHRYYSREVRVERRLFNDTLRSTTYDYVRYDTAGYVIAVPHVEADTLAVNPCASDDDFERPLRLGFGAAISCPPWMQEDSLFVDGGYGVTWTPGGGPPIQIASWKWYAVDGFWLSTFFADIGPVAAGNLWGPRLHYARVGGVEYGAPILTAAEVPPAGRSVTLSVAPNPAEGGATVRLTLPAPRDVRVEIFDILGRRVALLQSGLLGAGISLLAVPALPPGSYTVRARGVGVMARARLIVVR